MSSQQQQQNKRKRKLDPSSSSSPTPDESGQTRPQTKKAKLSNDKDIHDDEVPSWGCKDWRAQHDQGRAESERECYICLEDFYERRGEGFVTPCEHIFCVECLGFWVDWLQELGLEIRCPECKRVLEGVDTW